MPLIARQRSRLAVLAVLALVGSLLAVSAVPAVAAGDGKVSQPATASACVAAATEDAGFTDMGNSSAEKQTAANCLSHYGITKGRGDGTFGPRMNITRQQMALFMARALGPAGVEAGDPMDQGFTDIADFSDEVQNAINTVAAHDIMSGSDGAFDPGGTVSRADMAVILDGFLMAADVELDKTMLGDDMEVDQPFGDLGAVPFAAYNAINRMYEFGVAKGTGDGSTYSPGDTVDRGSMAVFVTRALAHTNARPAGISIQTKADGLISTSHDVSVSVRDEMHQPVPDALIDIFTSTNPDEAWNDDGTCDTDEVMGEGPCAIGDEDPATDPDGNTEGATVALGAEPGTTTVWAWTGEPGDKFDIDDVAYVTVEIDSAKPAAETAVSDDMKDNATRLKFGDTVTYTLQIVNDDGDPVASEGLGVTVRAVMEDTTADPDRPDTRTNESVMKTDAAGRIEISYTADDPDASDTSTGDQITLTLTLTPTTEDGVLALDVAGVTDLDGTDGSPFQMIWTDVDGVASDLSLSQRVNYHLNNDDGVRNTVQATLVDQYGDPVRSKKVSFWSGPTANVADPPATHGLGGSATEPAAERTTSRSGVATASYSRDQTAKYTEAIDAQFIRVEGDCEDALTTCTESDDVTIEADAVNHYWAMAGDGTVAASAVLVVDTDNNTIVVDESGPTILTYKAGDQFRISNAPVTMEAFEKELSIAGAGGSPTADQVDAQIGDDDDDINTFNITPGA